MESNGRHRRPLSRSNGLKTWRPDGWHRCGRPATNSFRSLVDGRCHDQRARKDSTIRPLRLLRLDRQLAIVRQFRCPVVFPGAALDDAPNRYCHLNHHRSRSAVWSSLWQPAKSYFLLKLTDFDRIKYLFNLCDFFLLIEYRKREYGLPLHPKSFWRCIGIFLYGNLKKTIDQVNFETIFFLKSITDVGLVEGVNRQCHPRGENRIANFRYAEFISRNN